MIHSTVKIDLGALEEFKDRLDKDLRSGGQIIGGSPINNALKQWSVRYRSFIQQRFLLYSRGGGDWKPLAQSTMARRRKGKKSGKAKYGIFAILRDTGQLFNAIEPIFSGKPGQLEEKIPFGIRVGYGGPGIYTKKHNESGGVHTIADIASFHQNGSKTLPKREIIVPPDQHTIDLMRQDMQRGIDKLLNHAQ